MFSFDIDININIKRFSQSDFSSANINASRLLMDPEETVKILQLLHIFFQFYVQQR